VSVRTTIARAIIRAYPTALSCSELAEGYDIPMEVVSQVISRFKRARLIELTSRGHRPWLYRAANIPGLKAVIDAERVRPGHDAEDGDRGSRREVWDFGPLLSCFPSRS